MKQALVVGSRRMDCTWAIDELGPVVSSAAGGCGGSDTIASWQHSTERQTAGVNTGQTKARAA
jgi:hypothetical protein